MSQIVRNISSNKKNRSSTFFVFVVQFQIDETMYLLADLVFSQETLTLNTPSSVGPSGIA